MRGEKEGRVKRGKERRERREKCKSNVKIDIIRGSNNKWEEEK